MNILGLSGFAKTGKDEVARILVKEHGFVRVSFADKLREMLYALDPLVSDQNGWVTCQEVIDEHGWEGYKNTVFGPEIRRLMQRLGTEAGREVLWDSIWIDAAFSNLDSDKIVVTDVRFYNELDSIRERGGRIWRVERPGVGPLNNHSSENEATDYSHFSAIILNNGTLEDLRTKVSRLIQN